MRSRVSPLLVATLASAQNTFMFYGTNEAGAEFAASVPGIPDTDFTFPNISAIDILMAAGLNTFRIPFAMERMAPNSLTDPLDEMYLSNLTAVVSHITAQEGFFAVIDPHNYGRYKGEIITDLEAFQTYWTMQAGPFADDAQVVFDCNNEFHDMGDDDMLVAKLNQACIDGVRAAGATSQYVFVEGTSYSGAHSWVSSGNADTMGGLTDPAAMIVYEMHQYLDEDSSGTHEECVSAEEGAQRLAEATEWLRANGKVGVIGEFAGANNDLCKEAVQSLLGVLQENNDVWMGWLWWAAGPFWGDYLFNLEPGEGIAFDNYLDILTKFAV